MNIFLVEDEPPILRSLKNTILAFHKDYAVVGTACTGQEAMDFIVKHHYEIDVMITDIRIPIISGLELTSFTQKNYPHILTIILTGYNRFEYAKTALQNGVFDYLLKPINKEDLAPLLEKAYAQKCVDSLHNASLGSVERRRSPDRESRYVLTLFCFGPCPISSADLLTLEAMPVYPDLQSHLKQYMSEEQFWVIPGQTPGEKNIMFFFPDQEFQEIPELLSECFRPLLSSVPTVTVIIYPTFTSLSAIRAAAVSLRDFAGSRVTLEKPQILLLQEDLETMPDDVSFRQYHTRLKELLEQKSLVLFHTELKNYIAEMKRCSPTQQTMFHALCDLFRLCGDILPDKISSATDSYATVCDVIACSNSYRALYENLNSIFDSYFEILMKDISAPARKADIIMQVDAYIKENYAKEINTASIAEHFGFTPAYLSKLFRESRSLTPSAYLIQIRIAKAKELLKASSEYRIKDVAAYVGYEDSLYFSKVFSSC